MINNTYGETTISVVLVVLLIALVNPFHFWMPDMLHMMMLAAALIVFAVFAAFILRERSTDEREGVHKMLAGRIAFLVGAAALIVGIVYQSYIDQLDNWLVVVLVVMIVSKIGAHLWSDRNY